MLYNITSIAYNQHTDIYTQTHIYMYIQSSTGTAAYKNAMKYVNYGLCLGIWLWMFHAVVIFHTE
jgi:hypothetical protein